MRYHTNNFPASTRDYTNNNGTNILILDDEFEIMSIIKAALVRQKYAVFGFTEPLIALEDFRINHTKYDLVICDLRMPGLNGFEFTNNIRQIKPEIKVILMTAFAVKDDSDFTKKLKSYRIDGFIQKPFSIKNLSKVVKTQI
jgi:CheY-like chemotaxis protein